MDKIENSARFDFEFPTPRLSPIVPVKLALHGSRNFPFLMKTYSKVLYVLKNASLVSENALFFLLTKHTNFSSSGVTFFSGTCVHVLNHLNLRLQPQIGCTTSYVSSWHCLYQARILA